MRSDPGTTFWIRLFHSKPPLVTNDFAPRTLRDTIRIAQIHTVDHSKGAPLYGRVGTLVNAEYALLKSEKLP
jgi:hypothetical protein